MMLNISSGYNFHVWISHCKWKGFSDVVAYVMDCDIEVNKFVLLRSLLDKHLWEKYDPLISITLGLFNDYCSSTGMDLALAHLMAHLMAHLALNVLMLNVPLNVPLKTQSKLNPPIINRSSIQYKPLICSASPFFLSTSKYIFRDASNNAGALGNAEYPSWPSLPGPLWLGVVAPDRVLSIDKKELFDHSTLRK